MAGKKRVTAADIARSLGISRATVGFVLNNTPGQTISTPTRELILAEAQRLGYRPNRAATTLASGRSRLVILVLPDWPVEHSILEHLDHVAQVLDSAGYSLVTTTTRPDSKAKPLWEVLDPDVVLGLAPFTEQQRTSMERTGTRMVLPAELNRTTSPAEDPGSLEGLHFDEGSRLQVAHLRSQGRSHLAFAGLADPRVAALVAQRESLARETANTFGDVLLVDAAAVDPEDLESAHSVLARWVDDGVDGVLAYNDTAAAIMLGAALSMGVDVPAQVAIIGHDDTPLSALVVPAMSSIHVDYSELGRYLAELALQAAGEDVGRIREPESSITVVRRATT